MLFIAGWTPLSTEERLDMFWDGTVYHFGIGLLLSLIVFVFFRLLSLIKGRTDGIPDKPKDTSTAVPVYPVTPPKEPIATKKTTAFTEKNAYKVIIAFELFQLASGVFWVLIA